MPPQRGGSVEDQPVELRRSYSDSDFSEVEDAPRKDYRDYRVRKSSLIG